MFSALMIIGGVVFAEAGVRNVGWGVLGLVVAIGSARWLLGDYIRHRAGFKRFLQGLVLLILLLFVANGIWHLDEAWAALLASLVDKAPWLEALFNWIAERFP